MEMAFQTPKIIFPYVKYVFLPPFDDHMYSKAKVSIFKGTSNF